MSVVVLEEKRRSQGNVGAPWSVRLMVSSGYVKECRMQQGVATWRGPYRGYDPSF